MSEVPLYTLGLCLRPCDGPMGGGRLLVIEVSLYPTLVHCGALNVSLCAGLAALRVRRVFRGHLITLLHPCTPEQSLIP